MIRNIWAVGRNYGAHAKEMGASIPTKPMIFLKAGSTAVMDSEVALYRGSNDIHHEVELALRFGSKTDENGALCFDAYAIALDLTARDLQAQLKAQSHPWTLAKSFRASCPVSKFQALTTETVVPRFQIELNVNGQVRQRGDTQDMIFDCETLRVYVCMNFPVEPGDLLLTGTPEGVGPLKPGDTAEAILKPVDAVASDVATSIRQTWNFR